MRPIAELSASPHWLTANLPIRAAREHSGTAAIMAGRRPGHVAAPHRWLPCSVLGPGGPPGGTSKECSRPSAPCASASALRPRPPRRGAAGYGPPLLRGYGPPAMRSPLRRGPPAPGSVGLGLSPPALTRRSAAVSAPPLASLRPMGGSDGSGTRSSGRPRAAPGGPMAHPPHHSGLPPGPSAPKPRWVPPGRPRPRPALPRPSVGWPLWAGCGLRSSRLGPGAAQGAAFFGPPAPGDGSRYSQGEYI